MKYRHKYPILLLLQLTFQKILSYPLTFKKEEALPEISSEEDSDDDDYNENMKKLEQDINKDYLYSYHPETKQINYKELLTLSKYYKKIKKEKLLTHYIKHYHFLQDMKKLKF